MVKVGDRLSMLVDTTDALAVFEEVRTITQEMFCDFDCNLIRTMFGDIQKLFAGKYPGYRRCNTEYHDIKHTTDTFIAMARILHGAQHDGIQLDKHDLLQGLAAALFHDTGYIQSSDDGEGTGAKYTKVHVDRSIEFMTRYFKDKNILVDDCAACSVIVAFTRLEGSAKQHGADPQTILLGTMLGTADLIGQMGDRIYLEKLLFLFREFREGGVPGYENEVDILKKTLDFYTFTQNRFDTVLGGVRRHFRSHFLARFSIPEDLYQLAIDNNMNYLRSILDKHELDYRTQLRRAGIVDMLDATINTSA